jgi:hypothetical protein
MKSTKRLIDIDKYVWGALKQFATVEERSINSALSLILQEALAKKGFVIFQNEN